MEVELIISGTPEGQDYYGPKESQQYMSLMYNTSTEENNKENNKKNNKESKSF